MKTLHKVVLALTGLFGKEETKADSTGTQEPEGTGLKKATLGALRRIQRQMAKAFSLVGTASMAGMGIAGLLLAPFPVPTTFSQA